MKPCELAVKLERQAACKTIWTSDKSVGVKLVMLDLQRPLLFVARALLVS